MIFVQHEEPTDAFARDSAGWQLAQGLLVEARGTRVFPRQTRSTAPTCTRGCRHWARRAC